MEGGAERAANFAKVITAMKVKGMMDPLTFKPLV
jgi:hypothetical protein